MTEKKPDLSDLKARLGLTKPAAAPPGASPPPGARPAPTASETTPSAVSPGAFAAPPGQFTPPGAPRQGAAPTGPPTSNAPPAQAPAPSNFAPPQAQPSAPQPMSAPPRSAGPGPGPAAAKGRRADVMASAPTEIDVHEMDRAPAFSKAVIIIFALCFVGGLVFGYAGSTSMFQNEIDAARVSDAQGLKDTFSKKIAAFNEILPKIMALKETSVDFATAEELTKSDFMAGGSLLANNRLLIGQVAIDQITSYTTDSQLLGAMLLEHNRLTNTVDKEELEQLKEDNKILEADFFGVVFDYKHALKSGGDEGYLPKEGTLVISRGPVEGEPGKLKVEYPSSGNEGTVDMVGYIPIGKSQILKSGGANANTRYQWRVRQIKFQADKIAKYSENVITALDAVIAE